MADLDSNGMATSGYGVGFPFTSDRAAPLLQERSQPVPDRKALVGEAANADELYMPQANAFPMPQSATADRTSLAFSNLALKGGLDLGPLTGIFDGLIDNPFSIGFGAQAPTFYKMRAWNTGSSAYEYWVSQGSPTASNPNNPGATYLAGSLSVIAVKRPKDLVGQGPA